MTGVDSADVATYKSAGKYLSDYTPYLKRGSLKGARIGIARDFTGKDPEVDRVVNEAVATLKKLGAEIVDPIKYPDYLLAGKQSIYNMLVASEFKAQVTEYLKTNFRTTPKRNSAPLAKPMG
jgi:amidase